MPQRRCRRRNQHWQNAHFSRNPCPLLFLWNLRYYTFIFLSQGKCIFASCFIGFCQCKHIPLIATGSVAANIYTYHRWKWPHIYELNCSPFSEWMIFKKTYCCYLKCKICTSLKNIFLCIAIYARLQAEGNDYDDVCIPSEEITLNEWSLQGNAVSRSKMAPTVAYGKRQTWSYHYRHPTGRRVGKISLKVYIHERRLFLPRVYVGICI